jgi:hypothetical protein
LGVRATGDVQFSETLFTGLFLKEKKRGGVGARQELCRFTVYLLIYDIFNDALSSSERVVLNDTMITVKLFGKEAIMP